MYPNVPIRYVAERDTLVNCNLCGGEPHCVSFCPHSQESKDWGVPELDTPYVYPAEDLVRKFIKPGFKGGADENVSQMRPGDAGYLRDAGWSFDDLSPGHHSV